MAVNLNAPLAWTRANAEEQRMLQALQGNILKGHGRGFTANIFFQFDPSRPVESKRLLRELANYHLTPAYRQLLDTEAFKETGEGGGAFAHLALSAKGYHALGLAACAPTDADFQGGMKSAASVAALADPPVATWEAPFQQDLHALLLAADETESRTAALARTLEALIADAGGTVVLVQHGKALHNSAGFGIENFGYVDGRSQPLLLQEDIDEESRSAGLLRWDPAFALDTALVQDPGANDPDSFGSYFVFRKLEQDVRGFKRREQEIADVLGLAGEDRELAGAMIVGRFEDGTPVTLSDEARGEEPPNDFDYTGDPGRRCPFHAHIRKANPRGSGGGEPEIAERLHLMPRRGIPYEDVKRTIHPDELPEGDTLEEFDDEVAPLLPTGGVGLLFMAYNHRIAQQFKFTQQSWVNNTGFPVVPPGPHGIDPVIGQGPPNPGDQKLPKEWDNPAAGTANNVTFAGFVKMRGGEYFFSPSLTFLKNL
jgi:Dyp-type peroxidase family